MKSRVTVAGVAEFKARLSRYLRVVKAGESVEIRERNVPVAILSAPKQKLTAEIIPPRKDPMLLGKYQPVVKPRRSFDVVEVLLEDRRKR